MIADTLILSAYAYIVRNDRKGMLFKEEKFPNVLVACHILVQKLSFVESEIIAFGSNNCNKYAKIYVLYIQSEVNFS